MRTHLRLEFVLRQGDFTLELHERLDVLVVALFGPSGSGKTTALEAIAGLRRPAAGVIEVGGQELFSSARRIDLPAARARHRLRAAGLGAVPAHERQEEHPVRRRTGRRHPARARAGDSRDRQPDRSRRALAVGRRAAAGGAGARADVVAGAAAAGRAAGRARPLAAPPHRALPAAHPRRTRRADGLREPRRRRGPRDRRPRDRPRSRPHGRRPASRARSSTRRADGRRPQSRQGRMPARIREGRPGVGGLRSLSARG